MPDDYKDCSEFEVDGTLYHLNYNFNDLVDAEPVVNCNLLAAVESLGTRAITAGQLRGLMYAMIVRYRGLPDKPEEALKVLGKLVRIDTLGDIHMAIGEACAIAVSEEYAEQYRAAMQPPAPPAKQEVAAETEPPV